MPEHLMQRNAPRFVDAHRGSVAYVQVSRGWTVAGQTRTVAFTIYAKLILWPLEHSAQLLLMLGRRGFAFFESLRHLDGIELAQTRLSTPSVMQYELLEIREGRLVSRRQ